MRWIVVSVFIILCINYVQFTNGTASFSKTHFSTCIVIWDFSNVGTSEYCFVVLFWLLEASYTSLLPALPCNFFSHLTRWTYLSLDLRDSATHRHPVYVSVIIQVTVALWAVFRRKHLLGFQLGSHERNKNIYHKWQSAVNFRVTEVFVVCSMECG
jgi:hypothetical protein